MYNKTIVNKAHKRPIKTMDFSIEEKPERPVYVFRSTKDRVKFVKTCEMTIRKSMEYKDYIKFLHNHLDMNHCEVLKNISNGNEKHYTIEIHHEPFHLFDIVDTVIYKRQALGEPINPFLIADEVMELHYDEKVGLIPLSKTVHELVHNDKIFIPLQFIYQKYDKFYEEYEMYMQPNLKDSIELKVNMSIRSSKVQSDILDPEFVYANIDGFNFPEVPEEWGKALKILNTEDLLNNNNPTEPTEPVPDRTTL